MRPLSNLDAMLRLATRVELKKLQRSLGVTAVYVTHDQEEAMTLADRMAVFREGEICQIGRPADVFAAPNCIEVAAFIGSPPMNLITTRTTAGGVLIGGRHVPVAASLEAGRAVVVGVRPSAVRFDPAGIPVTVEVVENLGDAAILDLTLDGTPAQGQIRPLPAAARRGDDGRVVRSRRHPSVRPNHRPADLTCSRPSNSRP